MHELRVVCSVYVVRKVDEKLSETALSGGVVSKNRGKGSVAKRLRKTLAQRLASASIIAQASDISNRSCDGGNCALTGGST